VSKAKKEPPDRSPITTHVLDVSLGRPAESVAVTLERWAGKDWEFLGKGSTNYDGRIDDLLPTGSLTAGRHRLSFATERYFKRCRRTATFYPWVTIEFEVVSTKEHYHVPLLISPFGYSTYRGS
jgi:5-hydroxyisourate hydrolase